MAKVSEHDLRSGKVSLSTMVAEGLRELKHIETALRALDALHKQPQAFGISVQNMAAQWTEVERLKGWMGSLNETFIGVIHLSPGLAWGKASERQLVSSLKASIDGSFDKWDRVSKASQGPGRGMGAGGLLTPQPIIGKMLEGLLK
jgi:hypothetical protein